MYSVTWPPVAGLGSSAANSIRTRTLPVERPAGALHGVGCQVPLTEAGCRIAVALQGLHECLAVLRQHRRVAGERPREFADHAEAHGVMVSPGHQRRPRADRGSDQVDECGNNGYLAIFADGFRPLLRCPCDWICAGQGRQASPSRGDPADRAAKGPLPQLLTAAGGIATGPGEPGLDEDDGVQVWLGPDGSGAYAHCAICARGSQGILP
jgi:hypothetical protein